ncbi:MAG: hypothetical protein ACFFG0_24205 [Candidatus Thorarchaeota archaeon]
MVFNLITPIDVLNTSYHNKNVTCQGYITKLSREFEDNSYGFIQIGTLQELKKDKQQTKYHHGIEIILPEELVDTVILGDKVEVTGTFIVYNINNNTMSYNAILVKYVKNLNDETYNNLSKKEIEDIENIAKQSFVQYKLAECIFKDIYINQDIKLIGTLILFCTDSIPLVKNGIKCNLSLLVVGSSGTYKSSFLRILKNLLPNNNFEFSQKSDRQFLTFNTRYKIGGEYCKKAGLVDLAKDGAVLIDNLEEIKEHKLNKLNQDFEEILKKSSVITAVHTIDNYYDHNLSVKNNIQFPRKNSLLKKFDLVLISDINSFDKVDNLRVFELLNERNKDEPILITKNLLRKYIIYSKYKFDPCFTPKAGNRIIEFKEQMIKLNMEKNPTYKLNSGNLVRVLTMLSKAYARISLKNEIDINNIEIIIRIYKQTLKNLCLI